MLLHLLSSHGPQFPSAHSITHKANCNWSNTEFDCIKKKRIVGGTTIQQVCTFFFFPFHLALTASPSLVLLSSLGTVIYFLGLFLTTCCMLSDTGKKEKMFVCVFLSVREPSVTVHLTGFFHTPKLLQPQLRNPENCKQAIQGLEFHTSLNSLLYHIIAF